MLSKQQKTQQRQTAYFAPFFQKNACFNQKTTKKQHLFTRYPKKP